MKKMFSQTISDARSFLADLLDFVFPRHCTVCGERLQKDEQFLCADCLLHLPRTGLASAEGNEIEQLFWGRVDIQHAMSFFKYHSASNYHRILMDLKFHGKPEIGIFMGRLMARELAGTKIFDGVDVIVPVPLAKSRLKKRGYNQSEMIARGISEITGLQIDTRSVVRTKANVSQIGKGRQQRQENVEGIFSVADSDALKGRHVLVIDDVLTTGATTCSLISEIQKVCDAKCSVLTMAVASN